MASASVSGSWKAAYPLGDEGLLTEAEGERLGSWIRSRVYDTELAPEDASSTLGLGYQGALGTRG